MKAGELEGCPLVNVGEGLGGAGPFQASGFLVCLLQKLRYIFFALERCPWPMIIASARSARKAVERRGALTLDDSL